MMITGATPNLPMKDFAMSGAGQVCAKAFTSLALAQGVSFPVVTLAKSGKMVPVMVGSIILGGARYSLREYSQVLAIIGGTCLVSMAKKKKAGGSSSSLGLVFILLSLTCDGIVGGLQKKLKVRQKCMHATPRATVATRAGCSALAAPHSALGTCHFSTASAGYACIWFASLHFALLCTHRCPTTAPSRPPPPRAARRRSRTISCSGPTCS